MTTYQPDQFAKVEIYRDAAGKYRWRRKAGNGQTTDGPQQGYGRRADCVQYAVKRNTDVAPERFYDLTRGGLIVRSVWIERVLGRNAG
jgi:uncharacterized protein